MAIQRYHHSYRPFMVIWKTRLQRYFLNVVVGANLPREIVAAIYEYIFEIDVYYFVPQIYTYDDIYAAAYSIYALVNIFRPLSGSAGLAFAN